MANQAVYGIVANRAKAERVIQNLVDAGISPQEVSFLSSQGEEYHEIKSNAMTPDGIRNWRTEERLTDRPHTKAEIDADGHRKQPGLGTEKHTKAPEGTTTGAVTGGIIGGALGLLAGIGALAIPGLGAFVAAGPILATLAGIGSGGTVGGVIGALVGAGIPEYEAKRYEDRIKEGGVLLAIRANNDDRAKQIKDILIKNGAEDVSISSEASMSKNYNKHS